jgi:tRNA nucleotidyltransferase (CCA-adding enzyme)
MRVSFQGWGGDAYPAETPQYEEDHPYLHDEPDYEPGSGEYNFFFGNGQLHVSPHHDHDELRGHANVGADSTGPVAVGQVSVEQGRATWTVDGNVSLRALSKALKDYTKQVGWKWHGLTSIDGQPIDDQFAPRASFYFAERDGHVYLAEKAEHLRTYSSRTHRIILAGRTAYVDRPLLRHAGLREWAEDSGFRLVAEYPGGSDMNDLLYQHEDLEQWNLGDSSAKPTPTNKEDLGTFACPNCGRKFPNFADYVDHRNSEGRLDEQLPEDASKFPELPDMDKTLPAHYHERFPVVSPLASWKEAARVPAFDDYADFWRLKDDKGLRHYAAYCGGQPCAFASVRPNGDGVADVVMVASSLPGRGYGTALLHALQNHFSTLRTSSVSSSGARLLQRCGFTRVAGQNWKWAAGQQPKDILEQPVPFVYDVDGDTIDFGQPGQRTSDVTPTQAPTFTPGGIVEGYYEPGGTITITTDTNMPYSLRHFHDLFYSLHPQMEIVNVQKQNADGSTQKLAATEVGNYVRTLALADPAAWQAYKALAAEGSEVSVVGGAVRDALLQKPSKDIDLLARNLSPDRVAHILDKLPGKLVKKTDENGNEVTTTGKDFGVFRYKYKGYEVEIALPRTEKSTGDRRKDFEVNVDHTLPLEDDLLRRDFTANAMAVRLDDGKLVDPYGGAKDIEQRVLRTVHPASFEEDPTRLVRALVASSRHGLTPTEQTRAEMTANAHRLDKEARERIKVELDKLFASDNPAGAMRLAQDTGVLKHIFPEVAHYWDYNQRNPHHKFTLGEHHLNVLEGVQEQTKDPVLRLAAFLHDVGKPGSRWTKCHECGHVQSDHDVERCENCGGTDLRGHFYRGPNGEGADHAVLGADLATDRLRALKYPTAVIKRVGHIITHHMFPAFSSARGARKFIHNVGDEHADDLLTLRYADQRGKGQTDEELAARTSVDQQRGLVEQARSTQAPTSQSALSVNGNDLVQMGAPQGPEIGKILRLLTNDVIEEPALNDRAMLMQRAQEYVNAIPS